MSSHKEPPRTQSIATVTSILLADLEVVKRKICVFCQSYLNGQALTSDTRSQHLFGIVQGVVRYCACLSSNIKHTSLCRALRTRYYRLRAFDPTLMQEVSFPGCHHPLWTVLLVQSGGSRILLTLVACISAKQLQGHVAD
jgi:hypothetical protein